jgi:hypothetical protein
MHTGEPAGAGRIQVCPLCHAPVSASMSVANAAEISALETQTPKLTGPSAEANLQVENEINGQGPESANN